MNKDLISKIEKAIRISIMYDYTHRGTENRKMTELYVNQLAQAMAKVCEVKIPQKAEIMETSIVKEVCYGENQFQYGWNAYRVEFLRLNPNLKEE
ncbi:MAG: hypothetical protein FJW63_07905 [Actinobacteria bacterium]|nr:hypothetical protein [Actinomycetota bacterium]